MRKWCPVLFVAVLGALVVVGNSAADDQPGGGTGSLSPEAEKRISALEAEVKDLKESKEKEEDPNTLRFYWDKGLRAKTADGNFSFKFGGRVMWDAQWFSQDSANKTAYGDLEDGTEFRRVRLYFSGDIYKDFFFKLQTDFAGGNVALKDAYIGAKNIPFLGHVRLGHQKEPFGLEELTSSKYTTFIERSLPIEAFAPSRNAGVMVYNTMFDEKATWALGAFRDTDDTGMALADRGYAVTGRVTACPWYAEKGARVLHLGVAYSHRVDPDGGARFRARPECHLSTVRFVDTGTITPVDTVDLLGLEAALVFGPFSVQGEYFRAAVENTSDFDFDGWYVQASYWLTGEHRKYDRGAGEFGRVSPKKNVSMNPGGWGAWELAARYSRLDLNDRTIAGGKQDDVTVGVNWHLNPNMRVMFNYIRAMTDRPDQGDADIFGMRFQVDF